MTVRAFVPLWQATTLCCNPYRGHVICTISGRRRQCNDRI